MQKTYSQKIARGFEISGYILLLPAALATLYATALITSAPWFTLLIYGIFVLGVTLLIGYFKHSRGRLDEKRICALWLTTAVYNFLLLLPWLLGVASYLQAPQKLAAGGNRSGLLILLSIVSGYFAAIAFSMKAFSLERRKKYI